ncbi:hypothetical protein C2845_PM07G01160 [Panicum miliaceum]|uniref:Uncharacterized protein n=1 Tax=Panicum miliaceum TaxID=4540 RepID=A0A3L6SR62_PANMI|nr:hypothetical protein C2845_PM07G01160 [Panicum miliaceum]
MLAHNYFATTQLNRKMVCVRALLPFSRRLAFGECAAWVDNSLPIPKRRTDSFVLACS